MRAFDRLDPVVQAAIRMRVELRKQFFLDETRDQRQLILLVGERPAPDAPDDDRFHFTPFGAEHHSSLWLNLQLHQAGIPEDRLAWANAYDRKGVATGLAAFSPPFLFRVALGRAAHDVLKSYELEHCTLHHPQAWKRFRSKEPYPLIDLIRGTLTS